MWLFWIIALVPITIGGFFFLFNKRICWQEWVGSTTIALVMAGLFQLIAGIGMTDDIETWSGEVVSTRQFSRWKEYYEYAVYRTEYYNETETYYETDSKGRSHSRTRTIRKSREVFDHWEPTSTWHDAYWKVYTTLGDWNIDVDKYHYLCKKFNDCHAVQGSRTTFSHNSRMIDGDPNDYVADNTTGWCEPVSDTRHFENRVKAAPTLFSYSKVPTNISVYPWPKTYDLFSTDRVLGTAKGLITTLKWDQMNAKLGPAKQVNVIIIGFGNAGTDMAHYQEAAWIGGKKNDLVICFGGGDKKNPANWVYVFGWTEKGMVKQTIQSLLLEEPISDKIIPMIDDLIRRHYVIKDWHKFDYITIEPPTWSYWVYFITIIVFQGGFYVWANLNDMDNKITGKTNFRPNDWIKRLTQYKNRGKLWLYGKTRSWFNR